MKKSEPTSAPISEHPWRFEVLPHGVFVSSKKFCVAKVCDENHARLIAAAPELLSVLERAVEVMDRQKVALCWIDDARATITKVKGGAT